MQLDMFSCVTLLQIYSGTLYLDILNMTRALSDLKCSVRLKSWPKQHHSMKNNHFNVLVIFLPTCNDELIVQSKKYQSFQH